MNKRATGYRGTDNNIRTNIVSFEESSCEFVERGEIYVYGGKKILLF